MLFVFLILSYMSCLCVLEMICQLFCLQSFSPIVRVVFVNEVFIPFHTHMLYLVIFDTHMRDQALFCSCLNFIIIVSSDKLT